MLVRVRGALGLLLALHALSLAVAWPQQHKPRFEDIWTPLMEAWDQPYNASEQKKNAALSKEMFVHAFNSYMSYGFPQDNVRPMSCTPSNSQGGIGLTLLDSLDSLLLFGMEEEFKKGVSLIEEHIHFNSSTRVHVFEVTIRALGGLLASHVAITENPAIVPNYNGVLLSKAQELAQQLLPAFNTSTGIPVSWINLKNGRIPGDMEETCVACSVTLAVEFRLLSHLTGNPIYGQKVDHAVSAIFARRDPNTHLVGNTLWTTTGEWERQDAGIGAGADSYYEYLLKMYLVFGDEGYLEMFVDQYASAQRHMAVQGTWHGFSWLLDVHMTNLSAIKGWVSSLSAFWPALQASIGQVREAHMLFGDYIAAFSHFGWIPEQVSVLLNQVHPSEVAYPLRPEVVESAFALWAATGEPRYQRAGEGILQTISTFNSGPCGYCSVQNIATGAMEDGMESFFLAETSKYLFLLFSNASAVLDHYVLSTEGHLLPVLPSPPRDTPPRAEHAARAESAVMPRVSDGVCPTLWRQQECAAVCEEKPAQQLRSEATAARAQFPALQFNVDSAQLLRQRRCRACRKVVDSLATRPPAPPCLQAETLGVRLDRQCGAEADTVSQPKAQNSSEASRSSRATGSHSAAAPPSKEELRFDVVVELLRKVEAGDAVISFLPDADRPAPSVGFEELETQSSGTVPTEKSVKGKPSPRSMQRGASDSVATSEASGGDSSSASATEPNAHTPLQHAAALTDSKAASMQPDDTTSLRSGGSVDSDIDLQVKELEGGLKMVMEMLSEVENIPESNLLEVKASVGGSGAVDIDSDNGNIATAGSEPLAHDSNQAEAIQQLSDATSALLQAALKASEEALGVESGTFQGADRTEGGGLEGLVAELEQQLAQGSGSGVAEALQRVKVDDACSAEGISTDGVSKYADAHQAQHTCAETHDHEKAPNEAVKSAANQHAKQKSVHDKGLKSEGERSAGEWRRGVQEPTERRAKPKAAKQSSDPVKNTVEEEALVQDLLAGWGISVSFTMDDTSAQEHQQDSAHAHAGNESHGNSQKVPQKEASAETHAEAHTHRNTSSDDSMHEDDDTFRQTLNGEKQSERLVAYGICFLRSTSDRGLQCSRTPLIPAAGLSFLTIQRLMPANIAVAQVIAKPRNTEREQATVAVRMECIHPCRAPAKSDTPQAPQSSPTADSGGNVVFFSASGATFGPELPQYPGQGIVAACSGPDKICREDVSAPQQSQRKDLEGYDWMLQVNSHINACAVDEEKIMAESPDKELPAEPPAQRCICNALPELFIAPQAGPMTSQTGANNADQPHAYENILEASEEASRRDSSQAESAEQELESWLQGPLMLAEPMDACGKLFMTHESHALVRGETGYTGAVVVAARGGCSFHEKALNAQHSGAVGLIVVNAPRWHLGRYMARWSQAGGVGWGNMHEVDDSDDGADLQMSPEVFLMGSGGGEWDNIDIQIPSVMVTGPQASGLVATMTCMHGINACVQRPLQRTRARGENSGAAEEAAPVEGGSGGLGSRLWSAIGGVLRSSLSSSKSTGGVSTHCASGLHAALFSGSEDSKKSPAWETEWRVLVADEANVWFRQEVEAGKLENYEKELGDALVRDLLPSINAWVDENQHRFSSFPNTIPDDQTFAKENMANWPHTTSDP